MDSKSTVIIALILTLSTAFALGASNGVCQQVQQIDGHFFEFTVLLRKMEMQEITADVQITFHNLPYDLSDPSLLVQVSQTWREHGGGGSYSMQMVVKEPISHTYEGTQTFTFHPTGNTELYPMDS